MRNKDCDENYRFLAKNVEFAVNPYFATGLIAIFLKEPPNKGFLFFKHLNNILMAHGLQSVYNLELRNAFKVFFPNLEGENVIEFHNVVGYVLELLHIFNPNLGKRPEKSILNGHFVIHGLQDNKPAIKRLP